MGANSKIEWTDHTFNPWTGCTKVSPACDHCYAEAWAKRAGHPERWRGERVRTSASNWGQPLKWDREAAAAGVRRRVFCASLADVFDNAVPPVWRADLFRLIRETTHLDWLLLTKRIGNAAKMIEEAMRAGGVGDHFRPDIPWQNVWLGATVVNQEEVDRDIPKLLATPARVRFLSIEPMLGPIELSNVTHRADCVSQLGKPAMAGIDWVIVGGESGHHARAMHPAWVRSIRDQCASAGVPFLFKQWGEYLPGDQAEIQRWTFEDDRGVHNFVVPNQTDSDWAGRVGKKGAGRLLDGVTHDGFPEPTV